jgi:hypothetical protein
MRLGPIALSVAICCTTALSAQKKNPYENVDVDVRRAAVRHARVWMPGDVGSRDLRLGPQDVPGFRPEATVHCDYVEEQQTGTPKFDCAISRDDRIRVKYGAENGEIYSEVAASRLLWALGFGADRMFPVRVVCKGCPADPMKAHKRVEGTREFPAAVVERKFPGDAIERDGDSGWGWVELSFVDQTAGGAPLAHRDALKLLAAMIQHSDNKPQQQRLVCRDRVKRVQPQPDGLCSHPFMMVNDLGKTFGRATLTNTDRTSAVNLEAWSSVPVWKEDDTCVAHLAKSFSGSLAHPTISEDGRRFLSGLLAQLSDRQLRDLFEVARFVRREPGVPTDDWVRVFRQKRDEIAGRRCTNPVL